jgi:hypothetical protein
MTHCRQIAPPCSLPVQSGTALLIPQLAGTGLLLRKCGRLTPQLLLEHENAARHHGALTQRWPALPASRAGGIEGLGCLWSREKEREESSRQLHTETP